jgi:plasmid stabilization system protein ParE
VAPGIRLSVFGQYGIYFRQDDERLIILRILHSRRDIAAISIDDDPTTH